jgi:SOS-response transcriptional repressor LexA
VYDRTPYEAWADVIVQAVADYWRTNGYGPSIRDICQITGMKTHSRMQRYIDRLQLEGRLVRAYDIPRTLRVPDRATGAISRED